MKQARLEVIRGKEHVFRATGEELWCVVAINVGTKTGFHVVVVWADATDGQVRQGTASTTADVDDWDKIERLGKLQRKQGKGCEEKKNGQMADSSFKT